MVNCTLQWVGARYAVLKIDDGGLYHTQQPYLITCNGKPYGEARRVIAVLHGLMPQTHYTVSLHTGGGEAVGQLSFGTRAESVTLDVRRFGARGDGQAEDTAAIQAAILACPPEGRVLLPKGRYPVTHLFLKSGIRLEIAKDAWLMGIPDRARIPILPGMVETTDEAGEVNLGTWEGNPLPISASLLTGLSIEDVEIYGEGVLDGRADFTNWWKDAKRIRDPWRPRMVFLNRCAQVTMVGLTVRNSPAWNIHPYFSKALRFWNLTIQSPASSPNTDGLNPESCAGVTIEGVRFSVGDDCIAIKSGKRYMGDAYATPSEDIRITHCDMGDGHGAVTLGSEMSGGIRRVLVARCAFHNTDRGLRVKTRRGRGKNAVIDDIAFEDIDMQRVKTPFTVNCFYRCDPDGDAPDVQDRRPAADTQHAPTIRALRFERIHAEGCEVAAACFLGLPERPISEITMRDVDMAFAKDAAPGEPIMTAGMAPMAKAGILATNVTSLQLQNVTVRGQDGPALIPENVQTLTVKGGNLA